MSSYITGGVIKWFKSLWDIVFQFLKILITDFPFGLTVIVWLAKNSVKAGSRHLRAQLADIWEVVKGASKPGGHVTLLCFDSSFHPKQWDLCRQRLRNSLTSVCLDFQKYIEITSCLSVKVDNNKNRQWISTWKSPHICGNYYICFFAWFFARIWNHVH